MKSKKMRGLWITIVSLFTISTSYAQVEAKVVENSGETVISDELLDNLKKNGAVSQETMNFSLYPRTELGKLAVTTWNEKDLPAYSSEHLFLVKKESLRKESKRPLECDFSLENVSKIVRSISTMQGAQYYSNNDKKWATLYENAYMISDPKTKKRIDDQTDGNADGKEFYCLLDDHSFGKGAYHLSYRQTEHEVSLCMTNIDALKIAMITGVKSRQMKINLVVTDFGDDYLIYMVVQAKYPSISFLEKRLRQSLQARIDAIFTWFTESF